MLSDSTRVSGFTGGAGPFRRAGALRALFPAFDGRDLARGFGAVFGRRFTE